MKPCREEVIRRALHAAFAVTGRARRVAATAAVGSALSLAAVSCSKPAQEVETPKEGTEATENTEETTAPNTTTEPETAEASEKASCVDADGGISDWACCAEHGMDTPGCQPCQEGETASCMTCRLPPEEGQPEEGAFPMGPEQDVECCAAVQYDYAYGCMAWGPPAPPAWNGRTLAELLGETPLREAA